MATTYGLTAAGWVGKPFEQVLSELQSGYLAILGDNAGTETDGTIPLNTLVGQEIVLLADGFSAIWDLLEGISVSFDPNQATDANLDDLCALTGTIRESSEFSTVTVTCTGTPLTVLNIGRKVKTSDTGAIFDSTQTKTITALSAWAGLHAYALGARVTNANRCYSCTTAGTSAASGGPSTTGSGIVDGTVRWVFLGPGTGAVDVPFEADTAGAIGALSGTLTTIVTPASGWQGAYNLLDASVGNVQDTDAELRARREGELAGQGGSTPDAIRAAVLKVNEGSIDPAHQPPTACTVFFNDTDLVDADGLPAHSVEILVQGGTDQDITQAVWNSVGAGTGTYGNQSGVATDSEGISQLVFWSRPVSVPIYVTTTVQYDASKWPANADTLVEQSILSALLTYGAQQVQIGVDVRLTILAAAIMTGPAATDDDGSAVVPAPDGSVAAPGILELNPLFFGTSPSPSGTATIAISRRQIATFDSSQCVITAATEVP